MCEFGQQRVPFGVDRVEPAQIGPVGGLGEFLVQIPQSLPVGGDRLLVETVQSGLDGDAGGVAYQVQRGDGPMWAADQFSEVNESAHFAERRGPVSRSDPPETARHRVQMYSAGILGCVVRFGWSTGTEPVAPPLCAEVLVGRQGPFAQPARSVRVAEYDRGPGEGVVDDAVKHHRARVENGPTGIWRQ